MGGCSTKNKEKLLFNFYYRQDTEMEANGDVVSEHKMDEVRNFDWTKGENYFSLFNKFVSYMHGNKHCDERGEGTYWMA